MTLQNFAKAREAMVVSQLQPSGIVSERVMAAYRAVPREMFVPNTLRGVSYLDDDIPLGVGSGGRTLMEPILHALMVQDAGLAEHDKVLDVAGATGYSAAVLAQLAGAVVAVEPEEKLLEEASQHWKALGVDGKITPLVGEPVEGYMTGAPYKAIFINGAVAEIPTRMLIELADGGALYAVLIEKDADMGKVVAVRQSKDGVISQTVLGQGVTAYAAGFAPKQEFIFA